MRRWWWPDIDFKITEMIDCHIKIINYEKLCEMLVSSSTNIRIKKVISSIDGQINNWFHIHMHNKIWTCCNMNYWFSYQMLKCLILLYKLSWIVHFRDVKTNYNWEFICGLLFAILNFPHTSHNHSLNVNTKLINNFDK